MPDTEIPVTPDTATTGGRRAMVREFLRDLFDLQFRTIMATRMLPGIYGLGIALAAIFTIYLTYRGFKDSVWEGFAWLLLLGPAAFIGLVTTLRITLEFVLAVFRIAGHIEHVAGSTQELSHHMPRFGLWRTLLYGDKANAPYTPPKMDEKPK